MGDLRNHFRPEFLNRLDEIIMFKPLTKDNISNIIDIQVKEINKLMQDKELCLSLTTKAKQFVCDRAYDPQYGARPLKRYLQKNVTTLAARLILEGNLKAHEEILIDVDEEKGELTAQVKQVPDEHKGE